MEIVKNYFIKGFQHFNYLRIALDYTVEMKNVSSFLINNFIPEF